MNFDDWVKSVPKTITGDPLWKVSAYRQSLFVADVGWYDVTQLSKDQRTKSLSDQLYRALGSIGANIAEGYSYGTGANRARLYEYSLGSARESRDWYYKGRHILGMHVVEHRLNMLTSIIKLLLVTVPDQRGKVMREDKPEYSVEFEQPKWHVLLDIPDFIEISNAVPFSPEN
jgi:four helix bundle protein